MRTLLSIAALLMSASGLCAQQVEITTVDGQKIRGELVSEDERQVTVQIAMPTKSGGTMKGNMPIARERIAAMADLPPVAAQYKEKAAGAADTSAAQLDLARWCRDNALAEAAVKHAKRAGELAPDDAGVGELLNQLGFWRHQGQWLPEGEYAQATGLVKHKDRFVSKDELVGLLAAEQAAAAQREKDKALNESKSRIVVAENRAQSFGREIDRLSKEEADLKAKIPEWESQVKQVEAKQRDVDRAQERVRSAEQRARNDNNNNRNNRGPVSSGSREVEDAQRDLNAARRELATARNAASTASASLASSKSRLAQIDASRKRAEQNKTQAEQEAAQAKQALAEAEKAAAAK